MNTLPCWSWSEQTTRSVLQLPTLSSVCTTHTFPSFTRLPAAQILNKVVTVFAALCIEIDEHKHKVREREKEELEGRGGEGRGGEKKVNLCLSSPGNHQVLSASAFVWGRR